MYKNSLVGTADVLVFKWKGLGRERPRIKLDRTFEKGADKA